MRLRILVGSLALMLGLLAYGVAVAELATHVVPGHWAARAVFFLVAGLLWVWPAAWLTGWMQRAAPHHPPPGS